MIEYITSNYIPLLCSFCGLVNISIGTFIFKSNPRSSINRSLFLFTIATALWILSIYLIYFFAVNLDEYKLFISIKLAYVFPLFFALFLFYFFYYFPKETFKLTKLIRWLINIVILSFTYLILFTPLIYRSPVIKDGVYHSDIFGNLYFLYTLFFVGFLVSSAILGTYKLFYAEGIDRKKLIFSSGGCWLFVFLSVMTNVILPIFDIYVLQFEAVSFTLFFVIAAFYSIIKYRFLNVKLTFSKNSRKILSFLLAVITGYGFAYILKKIKGDVSETHVYLSNAFIVIFSYSRYLPLLNSDYFHNFFATTSVEYFQRVTNELKNKIVIHKTITELENDLKKDFCKKLKIDKLKVVLLDDQNRKKYPHLIKHFQKCHEILVSKELELIHVQENKRIPYLKELKLLGEVCLPLFQYPSNELVGFFVLGEKLFKDAYSIEEIKAIQSLDKYLSFALMSILYNHELQTQVTRLNEVVTSTVNVAQHELRTPTNVVKFALESIKRNNVPPEMKKEMIESAYNATQKLTKIVEKIMNVQALEKGIKLNLTELNIHSFLLEIKEAFSFSLAHKKIKLITDLDIPKNTFVKADREKLWQVFFNLLDNAKEFTPENGKIILQAKKKNKDLVFKVIDNGEGVPKNKRDLIFERFGTNHHNKGIALGLYICKKIIELHKGKIWYENTKGGGASFCVSL